MLRVVKMLEVVWGDREGWPPVWCGETGGHNLAISQYSFQDGGSDIDNLPVGHQLTVTVATEKVEVFSPSVHKG